MIVGNKFFVLATAESLMKLDKLVSAIYAKVISDFTDSF